MFIEVTWRALTTLMLCIGTVNLESVLLVLRLLLLSALR